MDKDKYWWTVVLWTCRIDGTWAAFWLLITAMGTKQAPATPVSFWYWVMVAIFCWCIFGWLYFTYRNHHLPANKESKPSPWPDVVKQ